MNVLVYSLFYVIFLDKDQLRNYFPKISNLEVTKLSWTYSSVVFGSCEKVGHEQ